MPNCFNHPTTPARRRCFQCRKFVCPACQLSLDHHIFCSDVCHAAWQDKEKDKTVTKTKKAASDQKGLDNLRDEIRALNETIAAMRDRMAEVQAENTDLGQRVSRLLVEAQDVSDERDQMLATERALAELRDRLAGLEQADEAIRARIAESARPAGDALVRLDALLVRFGELETAQQELLREARRQAEERSAAERSAVERSAAERSADRAAADEAAARQDAALEERIAGLEKSLAEAMAGLAPPDDDSTQAALSRLETAAAQVARLSAEQEKLREELARARDETTAATLQELDGVKKRLRAYELSREPAREPARAYVSPRQRQERRKTIAAGAVLLGLLIIVSVWVGVYLARGKGQGGNGTAAGNTVAGATVAVSTGDNIVYDDLEPLLAPPVLDLGAERLALDRNQANIGGYAPGAVSVTLFVNNKKVAEQVVSEQGFDFPAVPLEPALNLIQVRAVDGAGNEAYSLAQVIERMSPAQARVRETLGLNRMRGPRKSRLLALTIDAGSTARRAENILAVLRDKNIKTTFFLTGQFITKYPDIVRQIIADGHEVGNHTWDHPHLTTFERNRRHYTSPGVTREVFQDQLLRTRKAFEDLTGQQMAGWWRAPYGEQNEEIRQWAEEVGFRHVDWTRTPVNFDMLDWVANPRDGHYLDGDGLYRRFLSIDTRSGAGGGIILMHLGTDRKGDFLDEVLPRAIDALRERGYDFINVSGMFSQ